MDDIIFSFWFDLWHLSLFLISSTFRFNILGEEQNVEVIKEGEIRETQLQHVRAVLEQQVIKADTEAAAKITDAEGKLRDAKTKADQVTIEGEFLTDFGRYYDYC